MDEVVGVLRVTVSGVQLGRRRFFDAVITAEEEDVPIAAFMVGCMRVFHELVDDEPFRYRENRGIWGDGVSISGV